MTLTLIIIYKIFISPIVKLFTKELSGEKNIPPKNGLIIVSNHNDSFDHWFIISTLPGRLKDIRFVAASLDKLKTLLLSSIIYWLGKPIIIDKKNGKREAFLAKIQGALENNQIVVIYPEGDTNKKSQLLRGKTGVAELALLTNYPVLPIGLKRTKKPLQTIVNIGQVIDLTEERKSLEIIQGNERAYYLLLRETADKIMREISKLCKKTYPY
jgi:1-acyl-sn-glycerol-3-phosphate acyltransferase